MKKTFCTLKLFGVLTLATLLLVSLTLPIGCVQKPSQEVLENKITDSVNSMFTQVDEQSVTIKEGISTDLTISFSDLSFGDEAIEDLLSKLQLVVGVDVKEDSGLLGLELVYENEEPISLVFTGNKEKLNVSTSLLDDSYEVALNDLMDMADLDELGDIKPLDFEKLNADAKVVANGLVKILFKNLSDKNLAIEQNVELTVLDETLKADTYTINFDAEDYSKIMNEALDYFSTNETARRLGLQIADLQGMSEADYDKMITDAKEEVTDTANEMDEDDAIFKFAISNGKIVLFEIADEEDNEVAMRFEMSPDKTKTQWRFSMLSDYENIVIDFIDTPNGSKHEGTLTFKVDDEQNFGVEFSFDSAKKSGLGIPYGTYKLTVNAEGEEVKFDVEVKAGTTGSDHIVKFSYPSEEISFTMNINSSDAPTKFTAPTGTPIDIATLTEEDLGELSNTLMFKLIEIPWISNLMFGAGE